MRCGTHTTAVLRRPPLCELTARSTRLRPLSPTTCKAPLHHPALRHARPAGGSAVCPAARQPAGAKAPPRRGPAARPERTKLSTVSDGGAAASASPTRPPLPRTVPVVCHQLPGTFLVASVKVRCCCPVCSRRDPEGVIWEPSHWQHHCGAARNASWQHSVKVVEGGDGDGGGSGGGSKVSIGKWLRKRQYVCLSRRGVTPAGGPPPLEIVPLDEEQDKATGSSRDQALEPLRVLPPEFDVSCQGTPGRFLTAPWLVRCGCAACAAEVAEVAAAGAEGRTEPDGEPGVMTPWRWEGHCGSLRKKAAESIKIQPGGGVADIPAGDRPISISAYLRRKGLKVVSQPTRGGRHLLVPLED